MNREAVLNTAKRIISEDRQTTYGDAKDSFQSIADLWGAYMGGTYTAHNVAIMMLLMKVARTTESTTHDDNYIDIAGYAALASELGEVVYGKEEK